MSRLSLLSVWLVVLGGLLWFLQNNLVIGTDLQLFLPSPTSEEERLLLEEIGEGPASRILVITIDGASAASLADTSRAFVSALHGNPHFRIVTNGEVTIDAATEELLATYRYLLSPTLDTNVLDEVFLSAQLQARLRDLASPAGGLLESILPRDPTLEQLKLLESWQPVDEPELLYDVWFDKSGTQALLVAETLAPAFDPVRQGAALAELQRQFRELATDNMNLTISGPGAFSVLMEQRTRSEAQMLGGVATVLMILMLFAAYRNFGSVVASALPLLTAGVAGLMVVSLVFGTVHGITLAFGFTLMGVAQDYPLHLLSHARPGRSPLQTARELWPTLATGVASTCIAYATFLFSGVAGLAQLACFTVTALFAAALTTRFAVPRVIGVPLRDYGDSRWLGVLWDWMTTLPKPRWAGAMLVSLCIAVIAFAPGPMWENDLGKLTPVPQDLLARDTELRAQLGSPDLRYILVMQNTSEESALLDLERLEPYLAALKQEGVIDGYDHAARYLPTIARQEERRQSLPDAGALQLALDAALADTPFRPSVFDPFLADVAQSRQLAPLTAQAVRNSQLGARFELLLDARGGNTIALVTFAGVGAPQALYDLAQFAGGDAVLLDLKSASESLVARQRTRLLWSLAVASLLLIGVVSIALRKRDRVVRVLAPMMLTTLIVLALLHGAGVALTLFHLIALILAAGLGLDYALFFEHAADDPGEQRRSLHAILVCALSTFSVFALLASSSLPVLQAIGITVALGVACNFVLALVLHKQDPASFK